MKILGYVPSMSTPGRRYAIRDFADGPGCDCVRFGFQRTCSHVAIYQAALHAIDRCSTAGHDAGTGDDNNNGLCGQNGLCRQCLLDVLAAAAVKVRKKYVPAEKLTEVKEAAKAKVQNIRDRAKRKKR